MVLPLALPRAEPVEVRDRANEQLAAVGPAGRDADYPRQISGGELQRVAIARALEYLNAAASTTDVEGRLCAL